MRHSQRFGLAAATVAAIVAAAVVMGSGGSLAAGLVGSADIRDNSIRSTDVRNGTLLMKDLGPNVRDQIHAQAPPSIAATMALQGPVGAIAGLSGTYVFAGVPAQVTTSASHRRITGSASAPLGLASGLPAQYADVGLCYQPSSGGLLTNFYGSNFSVQRFDVGRAVHAAAGTVVLAADQTWNVGMCVRNNGANAIADNNYVQGWLQLTT